MRGPFALYHNDDCHPIATIKGKSPDLTIEWHEDDCGMLGVQQEQRDAFAAKAMKVAQPKA